MRNTPRDVSRMLGEDLAQNGLRLESVSLTKLDQTPFHALDENNAFNALGMRRLAEIIATNKKERAEIEADAEVSVHQSQLNATKRKLTLSQEEEEAVIAQQREIETARASESRPTSLKSSRRRSAVVRPHESRESARCALQRSKGTEI